MEWTLSELRRFEDEPMHLQRTLDLKNAMKKRFPQQILAISPVQVDGFVTYNRGDATVAMQIKATVTVPSTRSLLPVELGLDFSFTESYTSDPAHLDRYDTENDLVFVLADGQTPIKFDEAVMENIIEQIPSRVLTPEEKAGASMPNGKDWDVKEEGSTDQEETNSVDPRLAKLKELFPDQDKED